MGIIQLNSENFETEIKKPEKILVDFFADWCGPCHQMSPIMEMLSNEKQYEGKLRFAKIDVDSNGAISEKYNVRSIPQFYIFQNGEIIESITGAMSKPVFEEKLKKFL